MIGLGMSALKVYLAVEPCDMRKGFNGLTTAASSRIHHPLCDSLSEEEQRFIDVVIFIIVLALQIWIFKDYLR